MRELPSRSPQLTIYNLCICEDSCPRYLYDLHSVSPLSVWTVAPEISMPNERISQSVGKETILECVITAFPQAYNVWKKDGNIIASTSKYRIEAFEEGDNTLTLSLRIRNIQPKDFGEYRCEAANALGKAENSTFLDGKCDNCIQSLLENSGVTRQRSRENNVS